MTPASLREHLSQHIPALAVFALLLAIPSYTLSPAREFEPLKFSFTAVHADFARFSFALDKSQPFRAQFTYDLVGASEEDTPASLEVRVNGKPVHQTAIDEGSLSRRVKFELAGEILAPGINEITVDLWDSAYKASRLSVDLYNYKGVSRSLLSGHTVYDLYAREFLGHDTWTGRILHGARLLAVFLILGLACRSAEYAVFRRIFADSFSLPVGCYFALPLPAWGMQIYSWTTRYQIVCPLSSIVLLVLMLLAAAILAVASARYAERLIEQGAHLLIVFAGQALLLFVGAIYFFRVNVPLWDDFSYALILFLKQALPDDPTATMDFWFSQDNEHRTILPRIVMALDYLFFGELSFLHLTWWGSTYLALMLWLHYNNLRVAQRKLFFFSPIVLMMAKLTGWDQLEGLMLLSHFYVQLLAGIAFYLVARNEDSMQRLLPALILAALAAFTLGQGLLVFVILSAYLLLRKRFASLGFTAATALFCYAAYFLILPYKLEVGNPHLKRMTKEAVTFYFTCLGTSVSFGNHDLALIGGVLLFALFAYLTWKKYYLKNPAVYLFMVFDLLTPALFAYARSRYGINQAFSGRYAIASQNLAILVYTASLETLFAPEDNRRRIVLAGWAGALTAALLIAAVPEMLGSLADYKYRRTAEINAWVADNQRLFFPLPRTAGNTLQEMIRAGLYRPPYELIAVPPAKLARSRSSDTLCRGESAELRTGFDALLLGPDPNHPSWIRVEGIVYENDPREEKADGIQVLLVSGNRRRVFATRGTDPSLSAYFNDTKGAVNTGFIALIGAGDLERGSYRVGICSGTRFTYLRDNRWKVFNSRHTGYPITNPIDKGRALGGAEHVDIVLH